MHVLFVITLTVVLSVDENLNFHGPDIYVLDHAQIYMWIYFIVCMLTIAYILKVNVSMHNIICVAITSRVYIDTKINRENSCQLIKFYALVLILCYNTVCEL